MIRFILLFVTLAIGLQAKVISNEKLRFKISFPESAGWSEVDHQTPSSEIQLWYAGNPSAGLGLNLQIIDAPMPEAKPTFQENAEEWGRGMMSRLSRKISARFTTLASHDAYELVASLKRGDIEVFYSNWMIQVGDVTYCVTIIAKDSSQLSGDVASAFLKSLEISK